MINNIKIFAFADEAGDDLNSQIMAMKRNNLDGVEIRNVDGINVKDISNSKAKQIKGIMENNGLQIWSIGSPIGKINITDAFESHLDDFKRLLEINEILNAKAIRLFSFYIPKGKDPNFYRDDVFERMLRLLEVAKGSNVVLCHENEKGIYGDTALRCLDIYNNALGIKGVFDPANFVQCGEDVLNAWNILKNHIEYIHIKDSNKDKIIVPAGEGEGQIAVIAEEYMRSGGRNFTIEPHLMEFSGLSQLERAGEKTKINNNRFCNSNEAFDYACNAFKKILNLY